MSYSTEPSTRDSCMQIVTKIERPDFLQINETDLKGLFILFDVVMETAHTLAQLSKTDVCVVTLLAAVIGDQRIKGFREKGE